MTKTRFFLAILFLCVVSIASLAQTLDAKVPSDFIIKMEEGAFEFKNVTIYYERMPFLKGRLVNKTTHEWHNLMFEVILYDRQGNRIPGTRNNKNPYCLIGTLPKDADGILGDTIGMLKDERIKGLFLAVESNQEPQTYEVRFYGGEYQVNYVPVLVAPKPSDDLKYEDEAIEIQWVFNKRQLAFALRNKTDLPIKLDWNQISYIDISGDAHKVMHQGVRYITRDEPQSPSFIPPTARLKDFIFPTDYVYRSNGSSGWEQRPLFPEGPEANAFKEKTFSIFMPLEINGTAKNYTFTLKITSVE